ncbi:hypothetical protein OOK36_53545 [Streptomyces sp. NBC_00365]|uniref:hypothetical protein n=1 Tax=Streptomyces sp. NBC_00365 TaxID=2975726 RepID=UPI00224DD0DD|nr:hypothetical protein [Streptomyces sp. NBC_00365]MCX5097325.1 hypothetical protein [Streptomyces sp. NBC_00365]
MTAEGLTEAAALALWCARLPGLREQARATGVTERLERDAARVRDGSSAQRAVRKWLQDADTETARNWSGRSVLNLVGLPGAPRTPTVTAGRYGCPLGKCDRTAGRDAQGHTPVCHAFGASMAPTA